MYFMIARSDVSRRHLRRELRPFNTLLAEVCARAKQRCVLRGNLATLSGSLGQAETTFSLDRLELRRVHQAQFAKEVKSN